MSYPSSADGGSTDIALEYLERPLIDNAIGPTIQNAEYSSLPIETTSEHHERSSIDTGPGPIGQNAEYTLLPTESTSENHERPSIDADTGPRAQNAKYTSLPTDEDATSHQAPTASWFYRITLDTWVPEALALLISAASIIAISVVLRLYRGKKLPELPYGITLDAIVSILATLSRSMLIFAVSIYIGQLKWCWYHERKRRVEDIQTLYPGRPSLDLHQKSPIVRTSNFTIDPYSVEWLNAIGAGIWSEAERFAQQPSCPSGNCRWKEYSSTGWCSKCQNATSYAKITDCRLDNDMFDANRPNDTPSCLVDFGHGNSFQVLSSSGARMHTSNIVRSAVWPLGLLNYNLSMPMDNATYAGVTDPIVALSIVHVQFCEETSTTALEKGLCITFAEECVLSLCTKQVETSVVNCTTDTVFTNKDFGCLSQVHDDSGEGLYGYGTHCWQAGKPCADLRFTDITSIDTEGYPALGFCSDGIVVQTSHVPYDASSPAAIMKLPEVQSQLLTRLTGNQTVEMTQDGYKWLAATSSYIIDYITAKGLRLVLTGVAASLTQQALLANTSEKVTGTVWTTETYVAVDWPWLIYPATLVLGAIILLALTAIHSHRCGLKIWKSSMLPLLYRTLDPDLLARQPVLQDVSTMTGVAGKAKVTVETSREDGVVLTQ